MKINVDSVGIIELVTYNSSMIENSVMNLKNNQLIVTFKKREGIPISEYMYDKVTIESYEAFRDAESTGKAFLGFIKPYNGIKIIGD